MEKKYLEVIIGGRKFGAFENVSSLTVDGDNLSFCSDDGCFDYHKDADGIWRCDDNNIEFDDYNYCGRRALNRHAPADQRMHVDPVEMDHDPRHEVPEEEPEVEPTEIGEAEPDFNEPEEDFEPDDTEE